MLPLAGIQLMRLYESALIRQTESALIAQGAFVAASFRSLVKDRADGQWWDNGVYLPEQNGLMRDGRWYPQPPTLDLATSKILPPFVDGQPGAQASVYHQQVGERLTVMLKDAQLVTLAGIRVVDPNGIIIASTGEDIGLSIKDSEEIELATQGLPASRLRRKSEVVETSIADPISRTSRIRVFVSSPITIEGRLLGAVLLSRTPPSITQALYAKRWLLLQGFGLLIVLVIVMSLLTFRLIARPISNLAEKADLIAQGKLSAGQSLERKSSRSFSTKEIARLQVAIGAMASNLEQRANHLQQFTRHISHEFKTPLASIRGAIEILQDHAADMDHKQRDKFLNNIGDDADRLHRLTQRLLELSKAELGSPTSESFTLHTLLRQVSEQLKPGVDVHSQELEDVSVFGDINMALAVMEVLFENGRQHDADAFTLWSRIEKHGDREWVSLYVHDNGSGISERNSAQIFTPFFTTQRETGGTGLGLTIALALMKQMHGDLALAKSSDNIESGTTFRLTFLSRDVQS